MGLHNVFWHRKTIGKYRQNIQNPKNEIKTNVKRLYLNSRWVDLFKSSIFQLNKNRLINKPSVTEYTVIKTVYMFTQMVKIKTVRTVTLTCIRKIFSNENELKQSYFVSFSTNFNILKVKKTQ